MAPALYSFGNSGTGILTGPGYFNVDLTLERQFVLTDDHPFVPAFAVAAACDTL